MKKSFFALLLFGAQLILLFTAGHYFGKYWNSLLLGFVSLALPIPFLLQDRGVFIPVKHVNMPARWAALVVAAVGLTWCGYRLHAAFYNYPKPELYSDVIPQLVALYERWARGEQPYYRVPLFGTPGPFPVYMPLHWLPIGIPRLLGRDVRWIGFFPLAFAVLFYIWKRARSWGSVVSALLPIAAYYMIIQYSDQDMMVTLEPLVAAYYLLLAIGLVSSNHFVVIVGIICCLLSRYTLVFWLPLFALLLWKYTPRRVSYITWGVTALAVLLLYVIPFLSKQPSILRDGVAYHNLCAVDDWHGYGDPPISWSQESGISFVPIMKAVLPGDAKEQVTIARMIQAGLMIGVVVLGFVYYKRLREKMSIYSFGLVALYYSVLLFYLFSPLSYRYYWISVLMLSAVLCGEVISAGPGRTAKAVNS